MGSPPYDPASYTDLANSVLDGHGLVTWIRPYGEVRAMYPPLYPLLLALFSPGGVSIVSILVLNTLIDIATAFTIVAIGRELEIRRADWAAWLYLLWPSLILSAPVAQKESLCILLAALAVLAWLRQSQVGFGLAAGLLALTQPSLAPLPVFMCLAMLPSTGLRKTASFTTTAAGAATLVLLPWWARNWLLFHQFVPLTTSLGHSLMTVVDGGNHIPLQPDVMALPEPQRSAIMGGRAAAIIGVDPLPYLKNVGYQTMKGLFDERFVVRRLEIPDLMWMRWITRLFYWPLLLAACVGSFNVDRRMLGILAACALTLATGIWFEFGERHRYFVLPLLMLLATCALWLVLDRRRQLQLLSVRDRVGRKPTV